MEFADDVLQTIDEKYEPFFDDETRSLFLDSVSDILAFYDDPDNSQLAYNDETFEERKDEIMETWNDIVSLVRCFFFLAHTRA